MLEAICSGFSRSKLCLSGDLGKLSFYSSRLDRFICLVNLAGLGIVMNTMIDVCNLHKTYRQNGKQIKILDGINFSVESGEFVVLKGENGSGKSTLINILLGLKKPSKGNVVMMGHSPKQAVSRSKVGVMLQKTTAPNHITVDELIDLIRAYYSDPLDKQTLLDFCGLGENRNAWASELSGGQERLLYFSLAITGNPDLLILDEPTVFLSEKSKLKLLHKIHDFCKDGKSVLLVTHEQEQSLDPILNLVTKRLLLKEGKLTIS